MPTFSRLWLSCCGLLGLLSGACGIKQTIQIALEGDTTELRPASEERAPGSDRHPDLLVLAVDGVDRKLLYDMLRAGELPGLSKLLSGTGGSLPHAHLDDTTLATLPSTTIPAWVTVFTGKPPAEHGVTGNEFFIRDDNRLGAPAPVTFSDRGTVLENLTDGYIGKLALVPSVFQLMRAREPQVLVWAATLPLHTGADVLMKPDRAMLLDGARALVQGQLKKRLTNNQSFQMYQRIDQNTTEAVVDALEDDDRSVADVIAIYYSGTDAYAHVSSHGPDRARREYLKDVLDDELEELQEALGARNALSNRWIVLTSDHGHTEVVEDDRHALAMDDDEDPPAVLERAGFRVRPFELEVDEDDDFQSVLAYQGALAYVYLADRSVCSKAGQRCDWKRPPRFERDVLEAADAFFLASRDGARVAQMKGTLDMVLARRPRPSRELDVPFEVYVGDGKLVPVRQYIARHPRPSYVALEERLRELAAGPAGERAGDVLLIANNGNRGRPEQRYYFSSPLRSWHGSPGRKDSEIPLIVAHPGKTSAQIALRARSVLGAEGRQHEIAKLLLDLRYGRAK